MYAVWVTDKRHGLSRVCSVGWGGVREKRILREIMYDEGTNKGKASEQPVLGDITHLHTYPCMCEGWGEGGRQTTRKRETTEKNYYPPPSIYFPFNCFSSEKFDTQL